MKHITFERPWLKLALIVGIAFLIVANLYALRNGNYLAAVWIVFQVVLLGLVIASHKWTKFVIEGISLLYAILNSFNLILLVIPLILQLVEPNNDFDNNLYVDLIVTMVKLICAILTYQFSKRCIRLNEPKSSYLWLELKFPLVWIRNVDEHSIF